MLGFCGIIGHPLGHSLSPVIHSAFAAQFGKVLDYSKIETVEEDFAAAVKNFFRSGGRGLNVTLPFKQRAFEITQVPDEWTALARAANTLCCHNGRMYGWNTDGLGLVRDLRDNLHCRLEGISVLILGAGGAARGIIGPLLNAGVARIVIANRTPARAERLIAQVSVYARADQQLTFSALDNIPGPHPDLVINASAAGIDHEIPRIAADKVDGSDCYDLLYGDPSIPFCDWARNHGARRVYDGLGMLVCQAAESFQIWHGLKPTTATVLESLRSQQPTTLRKRS